MLTVPVFLLYHLGILLIDLRNGVDLFTQLTLELLRHSLAGYVALTVAIAAGLVASAMWLRRKGTLRTAELAPVLIESTVLAVVMLFTVGWATQHIFAWQAGPPPMNAFEKIVMAAGAGLHEEIVFRVVLFAGLAWLLSRHPLVSRTLAVVAAAIVSALLFSAIHYVGSFSDTFSIVSFGFRFLAGLYLAGIYLWRGFAVAVYTHALYDLIVFFLV